MICPVCAVEMSKRKSYGEVEFDICTDHGVWLDKGELARIIESYDELGREARASAGDDARHHGRVEGMFLGLWSLFLPK